MFITVFIFRYIDLCTDNLVLKANFKTVWVRKHYHKTSFFQIIGGTATSALNVRTKAYSIFSSQHNEFSETIPLCEHLPSDNIINIDTVLQTQNQSVINIE